MSNPQPLSELLAALASDHISPGSGTAGAAAMAISRRHRASDEVALAAETQLKEIVRKSLQRAEVDSARFEEFLHRKNQQTARALLEADEETQALAAELGAVLDRIEPAVHPVVAGDILAARALLDAAARIQDRICDENRRAAASLAE